MKGLRGTAAKPKGDDAGDAKAVEFGQIAEWLVAGPFDAPAENLKEEIDREWVPNEAACRPDDGQKAGDAAWKKVQADGEMLDLNKVFGSLTGKGVYAHAWLYSPADCAVHVIIKGTAYRILLNGAETLRQDRENPSTVIYKTIRLARGWNRLLVKTIAQRKDNAEVCAPAGTCFVQIALYGGDPTGRYEEQNILWSAQPPQVGRYSCAQPLVVNGRVIVNADPWFLVCYDKMTGKRLWTTFNGQSECATAEERQKFPDQFKDIDSKANRLKELAAAFSGKIADRQEMFTLYADIRKLLQQVDKDKYYWNLTMRQEAGVAGLTSCCDGKYVYTWYADGVAVCHDLDGKRQWITLEAEGSRDKLRKGQPDLHGWQMSPVLAGDCFVAWMHKLIGFDRKTGKVKWTIDGAGDCEGFQMAPPPLNMTWKTAASETGVVYLPRLGFYMPDAGYFTSARCTRQGNRVFHPGVDTWAICAYDLPESPSADMKLKPVNLGLKAADAVPQADINTPGTWCGRWMQVATPLIHDGLCYTITTSGILRVFDARTLKPVYNQWLGLNTIKAPAYPYPLASGVCASPTLGGKYIYIWGGTGMTYVIKPGPKFELVARNRIERLLPGDYSSNYIGRPPEDKQWHRETTVSSPVFDGDRIYYQGEGYVYCIGNN